VKRTERAPSVRRRRRRADSDGERLARPSDARVPGAAERRRHAAILVLAAVGFVTSVYLVGLHENLAGGEATTSFCTISSEIDCTPVLRSRYASFWGVPIAAYGAWYYTVVAALAAVGSTSMTRTRAAAAARSIMLLGTTVLGALLSVVLASVSFFGIGALCPLCVLVCLVNLTLCATAWIDIARRPDGIEGAWATSRALVARRRSHAIGLGGAALVSLLALPIAYGLADATSEFCKAIRTAREAGPLSLTAYVDFQCHACKKLEQQLRRARTKSKFALVLANHPLEKDCNPWATRTTFDGSCLQARAAICATRQGRLDEFAERLFETGARDDPALSDLARTVGMDESTFRACLLAPDTAAELAEQVRIGRERGVRVMPALFVGDVRHVGALGAADLRCLEDRGR
jgi:uncharacterized membrane protein/predicted DsbA family dithiol-disulfide isomerase